MNSQMWYELPAENVATNQNIKHVVFTANKQIKSTCWTMKNQPSDFNIQNQTSMTN